LEDRMKQCYEFDIENYRGQGGHRGSSIFIPKDAMTDGQTPVIFKKLAQDSKCAESSSCLSVIEFYGKQQLVEPRDCKFDKCTSFDHRSEAWNVKLLNYQAEAADYHIAEEWVAEARELLWPVSLKTTYQNMQEGSQTNSEMASQYFPGEDTYKRLQQVKCKYDPYGVLGSDTRVIDNCTGCPSCKDEDQMCKEAMDWKGSYCKSYKRNPVCQGRGQTKLCACSDLKHGHPKWYI